MIRQSNDVTDHNICVVIITNIAEFSGFYLKVDVRCYVFQ